jgi:hypothetical protein
LWITGEVAAGRSVDARCIFDVIEREAVVAARAAISSCSDVCFTAVRACAVTVVKAGVTDVDAAGCIEARGVIDVREREAVVAARATVRDIKLHRHFTAIGGIPVAVFEASLAGVVVAASTIAEGTDDIRKFRAVVTARTAVCGGVEPRLAACRGKSVTVVIARLTAIEAAGPARAVGTDDIRQFRAVIAAGLAIRGVVGEVGLATVARRSVTIGKALHTGELYTLVA